MTSHCGEMAPRKGFPLFTRVINDDLLAPDKYWYVLNSRICKGSPGQFYKKSSVVASFPEEFVRGERRSLRLADGGRYDGKASSEFEILASSFGLLAIMLRQQPEKNSSSEDSAFLRIKHFLNGLDLSSLAIECRDGEVSSSADPSTTARRQLKMPCPATTPTQPEDGLGCTAMTPPASGTRSRLCSKDSPNLEEICQNTDIDTPEKALMVEKRGHRVIKDIHDVCDRHRESLANVLSYMCAFGDSEATAILNEVMENVSAKKGVKRTVLDLVGEGTYSKYVESLRVPDWILVYFKTKAQISGRTWQAVINITKLGRTGNSSDTPVLLNTNQIKAAKKVIFDVASNAVGIKKTPHPLQGFQVDIFSVVELIVRQQRLHQISAQVIQLMIKIDGRPFWGRDQVLVGIVPRHCPVYSHQSSKSVYPVAIANCKENRENLKVLLKDVNQQKKALKEKGIHVDGKHHDVEFIVTLDYKTLLLLLVKKDDTEFLLGGRGVNVEFCFICNAIRGCSCHDVAPDETCVDCLRSKANIGRATGIRDDLIFLLDEELSSIQLCALHMEMRNTEQLLASIGLLAYKVDALKEANAALKSYGPESFHGDRITIKKKSEQQSAVAKHNVHVSSMSGPTEREILHNIEDIVDHALPLEKLKKGYTDLNTAKNLILNRVTFCQRRIDEFSCVCH